MGLRSFKFRAKEMAPNICELARRIDGKIKNPLLIGIDFAGMPIAIGVHSALESRNAAIDSIRISSKLVEFDGKKFGEILARSGKENRPIVFIDWRVKSGSLGKILGEKMPANVKWIYAVLYDPLGGARTERGRGADISVSADGPWFGQMELNERTKARIGAEVKSCMKRKPLVRR